MRYVCAATTLLVATTVEQGVVAQRVPAPARFEVASVRPVTDASSAGLVRITERGQLVGRSTLKNLIVLAYGVEPYERVIAAESVATSMLEQRFEIDARPFESSLPPDREQVSAMARKMLEERFALKLRVDSEPIRGVVLRMSRPGVFGPGLRPAPEGCTRLPSDANPYDGKWTEAFGRSCLLTMFGRTRGTVTLDEFARVISFATGRPILNRTNLEGMFAIDVVFDRKSLGQGTPSRLGAPAPGSAGQGDAPAFTDALRDQMGLSARIEQQSVRLFVVEHVGPLVEN